MVSRNEGDSGGDGYVVVARRYRPRAFDELVGQDHVGQALKNAIETSRVGHAYLFTGARGVGKTSTARIFAKALNDPGGPTASPNATSEVALAIDSGEDVDVIEIDGASNRGIDEIRSLRANVGIRPSRSQYKIYIIDEVHMLTQAAFNALLKTLEEPPEHVKFIFCTTDPEKIPITVLSRCQRFDFAPVEVRKIVGRLSEIVAAEGAEADPEALELIARRATGSMRDSQSLLEQVLSFSDGKITADSVHSMLGTADETRLYALATAMAQRDSASVIQQLDQAIDAGVDAGRLAEQLLGFFRDLMTVNVGCDASLMRHCPASMQEELLKLGEQWGLQTVLAVVGMIDQTLVRIRHSVYSRVLLEVTAIQICNLPDLQNIANIASASGTAASTQPKPASQKKKLDPHKPVEQSAPVEHSAPKVETTSNAPILTSSTEKGLASDSIASPRTSHEANSSLGEKRAFSDTEAASAWKTSLAQMDDITAALAKNVERVQSPSPGKIELTFPAESGLAMRRCETTEHSLNLSKTLSEVMEMPVTVSFVAAKAKAVVVCEEQVSKGPSRMERMKEIEKNSLITACRELLDAEIVKIDRVR